MYALRELRKLRGLTHRQLAVKCACSPALILHMEHGRRRVTPRLARRLGKSLRVKPETFTAQTLDELISLFNGSDVMELMSTPDGRLFILWVARQRIEAGDVFFAGQIIQAANVEARFLAKEPV